MKDIAVQRKEAAEILDNAKPACAIKRVIDTRLGNEVGDQVWHAAAVRLAEIKSGYSAFTKAEERHIRGIFNAAAIYLALREHCPDNALEIVENGMAAYAKEAAKTYQRLVRLPLGRTIFLKAFALGAKKMFGASAGFSQEFHCSDMKSVRFDVLECPYVKYTKALGCPEIAHIFCNNDVYAYGYLEGIAFERTQTLGTGGSKCDFYLHKF